MSKGETIGDGPSSPSGRVRIEQVHPDHRIELIRKGPEGRDCLMCKTAFLPQDANSLYCPRCKERHDDL